MSILGHHGLKDNLTQKQTHLSHYFGDNCDKLCDISVYMYSSPLEFQKKLSVKDWAMNKGFSASVLTKRGRCSGQSGKFQYIFRGTLEQHTEPLNTHIGPWDEQATWPPLGDPEEDMAAKKKMKVTKMHVQNFPAEMNKTFCFTSMLLDQTDGDLQYLVCHTSSKHLFNTEVLAVIK